MKNNTLAPPFGIGVPLWEILDLPLIFVVALAVFCSKVLGVAARTRS